MTELKNCPFCGSEANFIDVDRDDYIYIMCKDGENCMANMGPHYTKEAAIKAWNTRAERMDETSAAHQNERMRDWFKKRTGLDSDLLIEHMKEIDRILNTRADGWISVEDRLPPTYTNILGFCFEDYIQEAYLVRIDEYDDEEDVPIFKSNVTERYLTVTHWMPIPKPPEEG